MASTNKTPNLNLSQFASTDKPAWLTDYNADMSSIDTAVKTNKEDIQANETAITSLGNDVSGLTSNVSTLSASVSQHGTDITDLKAQDIIIKNDITNLSNRIDNLSVKDNSNKISIASIVSQAPYKLIKTQGSVSNIFLELYAPNLTANAENIIATLDSDLRPTTTLIITTTAFDINFTNCETLIGFIRPNGEISIRTQGNVNNKPYYLISLTVIL